jgi:hypothetical protein
MIPDLSWWRRGLRRMQALRPEWPLAAAIEDDGDNAFICLVSKDLNQQVRVLAVASNAGAIRRLQLARAEMVFAPAMVGSRLIANLVQGQEIPAEFQDLLQGTMGGKAG